jgi:PAS domain S-box-containing protein
MSNGDSAQVVESHFSAIVDSSMDAIWTESLDGRVVSWNPAAERLYGYSAGEMLGHSAAVLLPFGGADGYEEVLRRIRGGERLGHHDTVHIARDGRRIDISMAVSPILDAAGDQVGMSVVARDVSSRREVERELARTRELLQARADELARSNEDLAQFAYVVSHDLSEPLRAISGFLQLLERRHAESLDDDARRYIGRSVEGAERMRALIDDLLAFSRAGGQELRMEPTDCNDVIAVALDGLGPAIQEAQATIRVSELPMVRANARQLTQVFQNLIANALKFRDGDRTTIEIVAAPGPPGHHRISVLDDGIGVDPRYTERVFGVFKRLHTRSKYPGTGIGLAICKRLVEAHGGRIWCEPRAEGGTAFHMSLPTASEPT